jgi:hypothetical protein
MPYFYKLSESMDENGDYVKDWFIKVVYTIADFTITCDKKTSDGTIFFIFHDPPNIKKHVHDYEYVNDENVPKNKIKYISDYTFEISDINPNFEVSRFELDNLNDDSIKFLSDTIDYMYNKYNDIFDELYIHITCKEYEESILKNGLSDNFGNKIGDDEDDNDEIQQQEYPSYQEQKYPSYQEQKYPSYQEQQEYPSYQEQKYPSYQEQQYPSYQEQKYPSYQEQQEYPSYQEQEYPSYQQQQYPSYQQHNYETQYSSYPQNNKHYGDDFTDEELLDFFGGKNKIKKSNKIKKNKSNKIKKNKSNKIKKRKNKTHKRKNNI